MVALKSGVAKLNGSKDGGRVYRTKVGCLRICEQGPTAVVYPEGTWYGGLAPAAWRVSSPRTWATGRAVEEFVIGRNEGTKR